MKWNEVPVLEETVRRKVLEEAKKRGEEVQEKQVPKGKQEVEVSECGEEQEQQQLDAKGLQEQKAKQKQDQTLKEVRREVTPLATHRQCS